MTDVTTSRFEFRTFMPDLGDLETTLCPLVKGAEWEASTEIYIISSRDEVHNVKLRDGHVDIKTLVYKERGLEQWQPSIKAPFPLAAALIRDHIWPALAVATPSLERDFYTQDQYLAELVDPHLALVAVSLHKRRRRFAVNECPAEQADVRVQGKRLQTVAVESPEVEVVLAAKERLGLDAYTNVHYVSAIKQIVGMATDRLEL